MPEIKLTRGLVAIVDDEDFSRLNKMKWCANKTGNAFYAVRRDGKKMTLMHRIIANAIQSQKIDHANGNTLDNRRSNLRVCTQQQNARNSKQRKDNHCGYKGVGKSHNKWKAGIRVNGKSIYLGTFENPRDAAIAYDTAARKHFGEFAKTNF